MSAELSGGSNAVPRPLIVNMSPNARPRRLSNPARYDLGIWQRRQGEAAGVRDHEQEREQPRCLRELTQQEHADREQYRRQERDASGTVSIDGPTDQGQSEGNQEVCRQAGSRDRAPGPSCIVGDRLGEYAACVVENWSEVDEHQETGADNDPPRAIESRNGCGNGTFGLQLFSQVGHCHPPLHARLGILLAHFVVREMLQRDHAVVTLLAWLSVTAERPNLRKRKLD